MSLPTDTAPRETGEFVRFTLFSPLLAGGQLVGEMQRVPDPRERSIISCYKEGRGHEDIDWGKLRMELFHERVDPKTGERHLHRFAARGRGIKDQ